MRFLTLCENVACICLVIYLGILNRKFSILIYLGERDLDKNPWRVSQSSVNEQRRQEGMFQLPDSR